MNSIGDKGQIERKYYQRRLPENPSKDYYFIMRETGNITPLLIEYGFIDNNNDIKKLNDNIIDYAEAVVKAVTNYTGYNYVSPEGFTDNTYLVVKGDSLYSIAKKFNTSVDELKRLNNLDSNLLNIGQVLIVNENKVPNNDEYINYVVKKGDSLYKIARIYETSVKELIRINNLKNTSLYIGQIIKVPKTEEENIIYTVVRGDSLYSIARRFNVTVQEIIDKNGLTSNILQIGDKLIIPKEKIDIPEELEYINYTVIRGDSLYSIAKKYNSSVTAIKNINNLNSDFLQIGQILKIPY